MGADHLKYFYESHYIKKECEYNMLNMSMEEILKSGQALESVLDTQINRLKERTYHFQKQQQQDLVVLERYDFNIGDFTKKIVDNTVTPVRHKYLTFIDFDFISAQRKLKFKRSGYMGKEIGPYDVSTRADIFDKNYMVFIEGKLVDFIKLIPNEQGIELVIAMKTGMDKTGVEESKFNTWKRTKAKATVIFFNNSDFNPMIVNREVLRKNGQFLSLQESGIVDELESDQKYLTFVTSNNFGYDNHLVFTPERDEMMTFFKSMDGWASNLNRAYINIYGFRNLAQSIIIPKGVTSFQIPGYKRPIPTENILVFRETLVGKRLASDVKLTKHYPNFYTIEGNVNNDVLNLFVFYSSDNTQDVGFTNELAPYYETLGNNVSTFDKAPAIVRDYQPNEIDYSIANYSQSGYTTPYEYKLQYLNMLADVHPDNLLDFLKEQYSTTDGLFVHVKHIDLYQRVRHDNRTEIDDIYQHVDFPEERYVITLKDIEQDGKYIFNLYIDGLRYIPDHAYRRGKYTYTYIPSFMILDETIIEIERFELFENSTQAVMDQINPTMSIEVQGKYTRGDIYLLNSDNRYIDPAKYRVFAVENYQFTTYEHDDLNFIPHNKIYISLLDPAEYGKVTVHIDRHHDYNVEIATNSALYASTSMRLDGPSIHRKFRVFFNGHHVPNHLFEVESTGVHMDETNILAGISQKEGDRVLFEYTPNAYLPLLNLDSLPTHHVIALHGITNRPFSLSWYDVYLNGKKLNKRHIRVLSPYLIQIINVGSINTFEIYAREGQQDVISTNTKTIIDMLWENNKGFQDGLTTYDKKSNNSEVDIFEEVFYFYLKQLKNFWLHEMKASFYHINPDIDQITPAVQAKYPNLFKRLTGYFHLNGDTHGPEGADVEVLHINPDDLQASAYTTELYDLYLFLQARGIHINPDDTIDESITAQFPIIFDGGQGVFINPDVLYQDPESKLMHINPDK